MLICPCNKHIDTRKEFKKHFHLPEFDFVDVKGQESIKRCMEIIAAGGHNIILIGPLGAGKTMLAKRLPSILPPMTLHEALESTNTHSFLASKVIITSTVFTQLHKSLKKTGFFSLTLTSYTME